MITLKTAIKDSYGIGNGIKFSDRDEAPVASGVNIMARKKADE